MRPLPIASSTAVSVLALACALGAICFLGMAGAGTAGEGGKQALVDASNAAARGEYEQARRKFELALLLGLSADDQVLAHYHLANCYRALGRKEEALNELRHALALDDAVLASTGASTRWRQYSLAALQQLQPNAATLTVSADAPNAKYEVAQLVGDRTGETHTYSGPAPYRLYGLTPGRYAVKVTSSDGQMAGWSVVTLGPQGTASESLALRQPCLLHLRLKPPTSQVKLRLENGFEVTASGDQVKLQCPPGRHTVEVSAPGLETQTREVVFQAQGESKYLRTVELKRSLRAGSQTIPVRRG